MTYCFNSIKAGVSLIDSDTIHSLGYVIMNINKSNSTPGADMDTFGYVVVADTTTVYALKSINNFSYRFSITIDSN